jgi:hypothetical protein
MQHAAGDSSAATGDGRVGGGDGDRGLHPVGDGVADDPVGPHVLDRAQIQLARAGRVFGVRSGRSAVPVFRLVRFCGPPPEPDVPVPEHPALHVLMPLLWLGVHGVGMRVPR